MGLCVARQLAEKGANVVVVARSEEKLRKALAHVKVCTGFPALFSSFLQLHCKLILSYLKEGASNVETQRFHHISADVSSPSEATRVIDEVVTWNSGNPPDIVSSSQCPPPHTSLTCLTFTGVGVVLCW